MVKKPRTWYLVSNAHKKIPLVELVHARGEQHAVEELFAQGCQEVGLNHCAVRSWTGWMHHITLTLLALWFLQTERLRLGKKNPGVSVSQVRWIFTELLRERPASLDEIAKKVSAVLRRSEEARINHWHDRTGSFPPQRPRPGPPHRVP